MADKSAPLAITMGEPAGIGADIILSSFRQSQSHLRSGFGVIGCAATLKRRAQLTQLSDIEVVPVDSAAQFQDAFKHGLPVLDVPLSDESRPGVLSPDSAGRVVEWIDIAVKLAFTGDIAGIVTAPIHKQTLYQAGFQHQGHTDYLAHLAVAAGYCAEPVMMLSVGDFRTVPLTVHIPLAQVPAAVTCSGIYAQAQVIDRDLRRYFGINRPRVAVVGLNPHAGESGTIGFEDRDIIAPAVARLKKAGVDAFGPVSADTLFHEQARSTYDVALCMYHDQALIPIKAIGFHEGINTTLGLPFVRTSPDHGTALQLAGTGNANSSSFLAALRQADDMSSSSHTERILAPSGVS